MNQQHGCNGDANVTSPDHDDTPRPDSASGYAVLEAVLKNTFGIMKYVMLLMAIAFSLSGLYFVDEGSIAVHTRFGRIVGPQGSQTVGPGGPYFALPSPLDEIRVAPTSLQEVSLQDAFWFREAANEADLPLEQRTILHSLAPETHGSLLTGDKNIVHARWSVSFRITYDQDAEDALLFFENVGSMTRARELVSDVVQRAAVRAVGGIRVEDFYRGDIDTAAIQSKAQSELDRMRTGLTIMAVSLKDRTVPLVTLRAFQAAGQAESEKTRQIEKARQERARILNQAAGAGYEQLLTALDAYERIRAEGDAEAIRSSEAEIDDLLLSDRTGGSASSMIRSSMTARTRTVEFVRGASQRFLAMLDLYNENPSLYRSRQIQDTIQRIFQQDVESFHLPNESNKTLYLEVGRNKK